MRRARAFFSSVIVIGALAALVSGALTARAQDDAISRIRDAYQDYATWNSYQVAVSETSDYAVAAQGGNSSLWQKQQRDITVSGGYDVTDRSNSLVSLTVSTRSTRSNETNGQSEPSQWAVDLNAALVNGQLYWRGSYAVDPQDQFSLPQDWTPFSGDDIAGAAPLVDVGLGRYLLQDGADPFIGEVQAWLDAAQLVSGPSSVRLDRSSDARGDLYVLDVPLDAAPDLLEGKFLGISEGQNAVVDRTALLETLAEDNVARWSVVLDPQTGRLLAQAIQFDLNVDLDSSALTPPYESLTLAYSTQQTVRFSAVNEPVDSTGLPGLQ